MDFLLLITRNLSVSPQGEAGPCGFGDGCHHLGTLGSSVWALGPGLERMKGVWKETSIPVPREDAHVCAGSVKSREPFG